MTAIELISELDELYFNRSFPFPFVANATLQECIDNEYGLMDREIQSFVNLTLLKNFTNSYTAFELSSCWNYKGKDKITKLFFIDFNPKIKDDTKEVNSQEVGEICINFNRHLKDITDDCLKAASAFLDKKLKEVEI